MIDLYKVRDLVNKALDAFYRNVWFLRCIHETRNSGGEISLSNLFLQKVVGFNRFVPWPVHRSTRVFGLRWIHIGVNTAPGLSHGCYIFAKEDSPIEIGDYTLVAPNVCIAGFNHDPLDIYSYQEKGGVRIGSYCWLGMNSVVLPGVTLGDHTVVAAGAVVTKSFPEGHCILGGNPARKIRDLSPDQVIKRRHPYEYRGYRRVRKSSI
jgi:acetyltransferase-like isoleucine patch superfamily enzyme